MPMKEPRLVTFQAEPKQIKKWKQRARKEGISLSEYLRQCANRGVER